MKLSEAIAANDPNAVRLALKRIKNINGGMRDIGYAPLTYAANRNADRVVDVLIDAGAAPQPDGPLHPLYCAASEGATAALAALLRKRQWEPGPVTAAMHAAALQGHVEALRLLFDLADAKADAKSLAAAAVTGRLGAVRLLLERGADPGELDGKTAPMHTAARAGYPDVLAEFLARGADVNLPDRQRRTPLMHAAMEHLSQRYARVNLRQRKRDLADPNSGVKLLSGSLAEPSYARRTIKTLLSAGADATLVDENGWSVLDILAHEKLRSDPWLERTLVAAGAPPVDRWPLQVVEAISKANVDALDELLAQGRDVNFMTARGFSPLTQAGRKGDPTIIERLLRAGADPNRTDRSESPLYAAVVGRNIDVVRLLLDAGADPSAAEPDQPDESPLRLAKGLGYREIAELIMSRGGTLDASRQKLRVEPGVHWWDDWEFIVVRATPAAIAAALDPSGSSVDLQALGKTMISRGTSTFVLVQPKGLAWTNVLQTSPQRHQGEPLNRYARRLAEACRAPAIYAAYSDTAVAAEFVRFEADGATSLEHGGYDLESAEMVVQFAEESGEDPPAWAVELIKQADAGEEPPDSSTQLDDLAKSEGFALGWAYFSVRPGERFEVEFPDYAASAIESAAFVHGPELDDA